MRRKRPWMMARLMLPGAHDIHKMHLGLQEPSHKGPISGCPRIGATAGARAATCFARGCAKAGLLLPSTRLGTVQRLRWMAVQSFWGFLYVVL